MVNQGAAAEFGRSAGGFVHVITKSGANEFEGGSWSGRAGHPRSQRRQGVAGAPLWRCGRAPRTGPRRGPSLGRRPSPTAERHCPPAPARNGPPIGPLATWILRPAITASRAGATATAGSTATNSAPTPRIRPLGVLWTGNLHQGGSHLRRLCGQLQFVELPVQVPHQDDLLAISFHDRQIRENCPARIKLRLQAPVGV